MAIVSLIVSSGTRLNVLYSSQFILLLLATQRWSSSSFSRHSTAAGMGSVMNRVSIELPREIRTCKASNAV